MPKNPVDLPKTPGHLIRRAQQLHNLRWHTEVSTEVTSTQFALMSAVAEHPAADQNSLAKQASLDTSTTADVVNRLHARGYLERERDRDDRRRNLLTLTEAGTELLGELSVRAARMNERLVECLPEGDRRDLVRILLRLVEGGERR